MSTSSEGKPLLPDDEGTDPLFEYVEQPEDEGVDPLFDYHSSDEHTAATSAATAHSATATNAPRGAAPSRVGKVTGVTDRRGSYNRKVDDKGESLEKPPAVRHSHFHYAWEHKQLVENFRLGKPCKPSCPFGGKCGMHFTPCNLIRAHEASFGKEKVRKVLEDGSIYYECEKSNRESTAFWRTLAANAITLSASDPSRRVENFTVDGIGPVCSDFCGAAYGIRIGTWNQIRSDARA
eukprot:6187862-Pleurochrysis_carterae.AAC.1